MRAERLSFFIPFKERPMLELPGLIDAHVHLREPGATHKEDFRTGTAAALAGGFTTVLAMPNTQPPLTDKKSLETVAALAAPKAYCDYGFFLGAGEDNLESAAALSHRVSGMKMYLDQTYGPLRLDSLEQIESHVARWPETSLIAAHAEGRSLTAILLFSGIYNKRVHICHVSRKEEIALIKKAKEKGYPVTCEVTPHHLFLTEADIPAIGAGRMEVRPRLATRVDQAALWENLEVVDCFATDHAPHTLEEKDSDTPPPGFPGLETALSLFLGAVSDGRLTMQALIERMHENPARIFSLPTDDETKILVDLDASWEVRAKEMQSKSGWSPFEGTKLKGKIRQVILRGERVFEHDQVLARSGFGRNLNFAAQIHTTKEV
jgi:carbamoyl-phosphate synthase/aspartate carbamoyltransferase/dihydroorotase